MPEALVTSLNYRKNTAFPHSPNIHSDGILFGESQLVSAVSFILSLNLDITLGEMYVDWIVTAAVHGRIFKLSERI